MFLEFCESFEKFPTIKNSHFNEKRMYFSGILLSFRVISESEELRRKAHRVTLCKFHKSAFIELKGKEVIIYF